MMSFLVSFHFSVTICDFQVIASYTPLRIFYQRQSVGKKRKDLVAFNPISLSHCNGIFHATCIAARPAFPKSNHTYTPIHT